MKQTAVEWLVREFRKNRITVPMEMEQQAKEMEKEQNEKTFKQAQECAVKADGVYFKYESFEQYYIEKYSK